MIRQGQKEDATRIIEVLSACGTHLRNQGIDQWDENYPSLSQIEIDIRHKELFVIVVHKTIQGCVVLNEVQDKEYFELDWLTDNNENHLVVHRLGIHPDSQGKGLARQLMDFAENLAKDRKYKSIRLDTFSQNTKNQAFYKKRGYKEVGSVFLSYKKDHPYFCYELLTSWIK
jgi:ribosomal protein S18 acetylase RimI-like enzyme